MSEYVPCPICGFTIENMTACPKCYPPPSTGRPKCNHCDAPMELSAGWYPTPQDPDNAGMAPMAEPFCPKCDGGLAARVLAMCKKRNWSLHWTARGSYLHLESSELIEALRGKRGDPLSEAADVLLVLMSITENHGLKWSDVVAQTERTVERLERCEQYKGEERIDNTEPGDDAIVS